MCLTLKEVQLYKVLRADYRSPYYLSQWPREGWMDSGRNPLLAEAEMGRKYVTQGLHFYTDMTFDINVGEIVVECWGVPLAWDGHRAVTSHCRVRKVLFGDGLIRLADKLNLCIGLDTWYYKGDCIAHKWDELMEYREYKEYCSDVESGYWKNVVNNRSTKEW